MPDEQKSFWATIPGIITAIATLVTAIGGFIIVLNQVGVFGSKPEPKKEDPKGGITNQRAIEGMTEAELTIKQMELETKLSEMEQKLAHQQQSPSASGQSTQQSSEPFQDIAQLAGIWYFDNGVYWNISQSGVSITMQEYSFLFGTQILSAGGQGTVIGRKAFIDFTTLSGGSGRTEMTLANDQRSLTGVLKDSFGNTLMNLYLTRSFDNE